MKNKITIQQQNEILSILDNFHILFVAENIGVEYLTEAEKQQLQEFGFDLEQNFESKYDQMFKFGIIAETLGQDNVRNLTYKNFLKYLKSGKFAPLTEAENQALEAVKSQAYNDIKGLGNRVCAQTNQIFIEADSVQRVKYEKIIEQQLKTTLQNRDSIKQMASELGHKTLDWARDFDRISDFTMHCALEQGVSAAIVRRSGSNALVYKDVYDGACEHCVRLYLTKGVGSQPKLFKLNDLILNGSNIGRKVKQWKPILGSTHPFCRCTLTQLPENVEWSEQTKMFETISKNPKITTRRSRARIQVEF